MLIVIPKRILAELFSHALGSDPEECCGVLVGSDGEARSITRMRNEHSQPIRRYQMSPIELMRAEQNADAKGESIVAIYHSHTFTQAYPSKTDIRNAIESGWTDPIYLLISLVEKTRPIARAFKLSDCGAVSEVYIATDGKAYQEMTEPS